VQDFTGPLSSTNLTYFFTNGLTVTSNTYTFNIALVTSKDLDSDGDGIVNFEDPTPIYVAQSAALNVALAADLPRTIQIGWNALAYSSNFVEAASPASGNWTVLTNFLHGPYTSPVRVFDRVPTNGAARVYRLRAYRRPSSY